MSGESVGVMGWSQLVGRHPIPRRGYARRPLPGEGAQIRNQVLGLRFRGYLLTANSQLLTSNKQLTTRLNKNIIFKMFVFGAIFHGY